MHVAFDMSVVWIECFALEITQMWNSLPLPLNEFNHSDEYGVVVASTFLQH